MNLKNPIKNVIIEKELWEVNDSGSLVNTTCNRTKR